jgi:hypothetical protein
MATQVYTAKMSAVINANSTLSSLSAQTMATIASANGNPNDPNPSVTIGKALSLLQGAVSSYQAITGGNYSSFYTAVSGVNPANAGTPAAAGAPTGPGTNAGASSAAAAGAPPGYQGTAAQWAADPANPANQSATNNSVG